MKKIGMVGGVSWLSTIEYYRAICELRAEFDSYFNSALKRLEASGAEIAFIASNTPHNRFDYIVKGISMPVISIFEAVAKYCADIDLEKILILGTAPTMESSTFSDVLARHGINGFTPKSDTDRSAIINVIGEMHSGDIYDKADAIHQVVNNAVDRFSGSPVTAGLSCTELPLAFPDHLEKLSFEVDGVRYMNTTVIHANAIFESASGMRVCL